MKRTKERFGKLEMDLEYQDRFKLQQCQQKAWIEQKKYEHDKRTRRSEKKKENMQSRPWQ